jgi:hypothetical protein
VNTISVTLILSVALKETVEEKLLVAIRKDDKGKKAEFDWKLESENESDKEIDSVLEKSSVRENDSV